MAKFRNTETGNILSVKNEKTIALMEKSDRYTRVQDQPAKAAAPAKKNTKK